MAVKLHAIPAQKVSFMTESKLKRGTAVDSEPKALRRLPEGTMVMDMYRARKAPAPARARPASSRSGQRSMSKQLSLLPPLPPL